MKVFKEKSYSKREPSIKIDGADKPSKRISQLSDKQLENMAKYANLTEKQRREISKRYNKAALPSGAAVGSGVGMLIEGARTQKLSAPAILAGAAVGSGLMYGLGVHRDARDQRRALSAKKELERRRKQRSFSWSLFGKSFEPDPSDFGEGWRFHKLKDQDLFKIGNSIAYIRRELDDRRICVDYEAFVYNGFDEWKNGCIAIRTSCKSNDIWPVCSVGDDYLVYHKKLGIYTTVKLDNKELFEKDLQKNKVQSPLKWFKFTLSKSLRDIKDDPLMSEDLLKIDKEFLDKQIGWIERL